MRRTRGSNQYEPKIQWGSSNKFVFIVFVLMALISGIVSFAYSEDTIVLYASEPTTTPTPEVELTISKVQEEGSSGSAAPPVVGDENAIYIFNQFSQYGKNVAIEALRISYKESGWRTDALNCKHNNPPDSCDRGVWQINDHWHPEVSDECAFDLECSTKEAKRIYEESGWSQWVASDVL